MPFLNRSLSLVLSVCLMSAGVGMGAMITPSAHAADAAYAPGQLIIKFRDHVADADKARVLSSVSGHQIDTLNFINAIVVSVPQTKSLPQWIQIARGNQVVKYAEPNYILKVSATAAPAPATDNDTYFSKEWDMSSTGANASQADIDVTDAWTEYKPKGTVIVAVIDTGVNYTHPDLAANVWYNTGEDVDKNGIQTAKDNNGKDNDKDGYINDFYGWNFDKNTADPNDDNGHGTHVAGTIAAIVNNRYGIAGVAGQGSVKIMSLKFMNSSGSGTTTAAIKAIDYASAHGAKIANNSWGGAGYNQPLYDAIQRFQQAGGLFIVAAGNNGTSNDTSPTYPAAYTLPNVVSVGSLSAADTLSTFSNYGAKTVNIAAPGENILSTYPGGFAYMSGTSMASPHVAGVAALILSQNPALKYSDVRNILLNSAKPNKNLTGKVSSGGDLNAKRALDAVH